MSVQFWVDMIQSVSIILIGITSILQNKHK